MLFFASSNAFPDEEEILLNKDVFYCVFEFMPLDNTLPLCKCLSQDIRRKVCQRIESDGNAVHFKVIHDFMSLLDEINSNVFDKAKFNNTVESMNKMIKGGIKNYVNRKCIFNSHWYGPDGFKQPSENSVYLRFDERTYLHFHKAFVLKLEYANDKMDDKIFLTFKPTIYNLTQFCDIYRKVCEAIVSFHFYNDGMELNCTLQIDQNHCFLYFGRTFTF